MPVSMIVLRYFSLKQRSVTVPPVSDIPSNSSCFFCHTLRLLSVSPCFSSPLSQDSVKNKCSLLDPVASDFSWCPAFITGFLFCSEKHCQDTIFFFFLLGICVKTTSLKGGECRNTSGTFQDAAGRFKWQLKS